jgi:arginine repressor
MKSIRQSEIIRLISDRDIDTQEELASLLRDRGYKVTQATISRDIRELRLIKISDQNGGLKYARPDRPETAVSERLTRILSDSLISAACSGNLIVVKTLSGSANVAAEAIDTLGWPEILGTIAGDNTIFVAVGKENDASEVTERILRLTEQR